MLGFNDTAVRSMHKNSHVQIINSKILKTINDIYTFTYKMYKIKMFKTKQ